MKLRIGCVVVGLLLFVLSLAAQTASSGSTSSQVPPLIPFSNVATDEGGNSLSGVVSLTFSLYAAQQGGEPLWTETQNNVPLDPTGHYSVQLGITKPGGLPTTLFTTGEARWLGVRIAEQPEQPRVLLLSVPYAMKAGDAATIGGLPPSAFVLAAPANGITPAYTTELATGQSVSPATSTDVTTSGGTVGFIPLWDSTSDIISSVLFQSGTGSTAKVGINTATPATTLDVKGGSTIRGTLSLPATGKATATKGDNSQPLNLAASAYNSSTPAAVNQTFQWLAEPAGNNTSTPSGTLNLLFGSGTTKPSETGLDIASNGQITFATGQTFPGTGTGDGTVTSVATGLGLKGGLITTSGTLTIDPAVIPQLGAANTFTANQTVTGTLSVSSSGNTIIGSTSGAADSGVTGTGSSTSGTGVLGIGANGVAGQSAYVNGDGVFGSASSTSGLATGVLGTTLSPTGYGVQGQNNATTGTAVGVSGTTASAAGYGVEGTSPYIGIFGQGTTAGVSGQTATIGGYGVKGTSPSIGVYGTGLAGVDGVTTSTSGYGVEGYANATTGTSTGVYGANYSTAGGAGVMGSSLAATGASVGVYGGVNSPTGYGVEGAAGGGTAGFFQVQSSSGTILQGNNGSTTEFKVDSAGDVIAAGAVNAAGAVSGSSFQIGANLFAFGSNGNADAFLGYAGRNGIGVSFDTGVGYGALAKDAVGDNTAVGYFALYTDTTGTNNTAIGSNAGDTQDTSNLTGSNNTALGAFAVLSTGTLSNATAIGANAVVSESNALVLGYGANVGIGTSAPGHLLDVAGTAAVDSLGQNNGTGIDLTFGLSAGEGISSSRTAAPNQYGIDLWTDFARRISIEQHGNVGIGTTSPDNLLTVNGSADKPGGGSWGTFSDARLKTVNGGFTDGLSQVMKINPIHYRYKPGNAMGIRDTDEHIGVVAQEVQKVIPEAVTENSKGYLLVNNDPIIWTMLNAIKEQQGEFQQEKTELTKALHLIKQQQNLLRAQSAAMRSLEVEVREARESLRKVKAQVSAAQPALIAAK